MTLPENFEELDKIDVGLILGSGIPFNSDLDVEADAKLSDILSNVDEFEGTGEIEGHSDRLAVGTVEDVRIGVLYGRLHYYEGLPAWVIALPVRIFDELGANSLITTNSAGAVNKSFRPGDIMIIEDHINMIGDNPLRGYSSDDVLFGSAPEEVFVDMSEPYDSSFQEEAKSILFDSSLNLRKGVYMANSGPTYETPAEVEFARSVGADVVGMSTVPEVIVANQLSIPVLGLTCVTNMAAGVGSSPLSHKEVVETTESVNDELSDALTAIVKKIGD